MSDSSFWSSKRVCVTGGGGFLGRRLCQALSERGCPDAFVPRREEYDLTDAAAVRRMYRDADPDVVIHLAAEVGGIGANQQQPGRFFYANLAMGLHLIEEGRRQRLHKFVQIGTVCAYPKHCPVPFREDDLWNGYPEETNAAYGIAKKALLAMLQAYRSQYGFNGIYLLPVNLYGPGDNFDPEDSHVIPALICKFDQGRPRSSAGAPAKPPASSSTWTTPLRASSPPRRATTARYPLTSAADMRSASATWLP